MAMSRAEVRRAFRVVMAEDYADVPLAEEIDHVFSATFLAKMEHLVAAEKRGSWQLLPRRRRRALIVAAVLAAALLLSACSPTVRKAVTEFVVSIYEREIDIHIKTGLHEELETIYVLDPVPEGFTFVSQTQYTPYFAEARYEDGHGKLLWLKQWASQDSATSIKNVQDEVQVIGESENRVVIRCAEGLSSMTWIYDGYYMSLSYFGWMDSEQLLALKTALVPIETGQE